MYAHILATRSFFLALNPNLGHGYVGLQLVYLRPQPTLMRAVYYVAASETGIRGGQSQASTGGASLALSLWEFRITWVLAQRVRWSHCFALPWSWDGEHRLEHHADISAHTVGSYELLCPSARSACLWIMCSLLPCCVFFFILPMHHSRVNPDKPEPAPLLLYMAVHYVPRLFLPSCPARVPFPRTITWPPLFV